MKVKKFGPRWGRWDASSLRSAIRQSINADVCDVKHQCDKDVYVSENFYLLQGPILHMFCLTNSSPSRIVCLIGWSRVSGKMKTRAPPISAMAPNINSGNSRLISDWKKTKRFVIVEPLVLYNLEIQIRACSSLGV